MVPTMTLMSFSYQKGKDFDKYVITREFRVQVVIYVITHHQAPFQV